MLNSISGGPTAATNGHHLEAMPKQDSPAIILVDYRLVDGWHIFTSEHVRGLYIAHPDQRAAFDAIGPAIEKLLAENERVHVEVKPAKTFNAFLDELKQHADMAEIMPGQPQPFMVTAAHAL